MSAELAFGAHAYQPYRKAQHQGLSLINTSPDGKDWSAEATDLCYRPLAENEVLKLPFSLTVFPVLLEYLADNAPDVLLPIHESLRANRIGTPAIHVLLPDLPDEDKRIIVASGYRYFEKKVGMKPQIVWAPETAWDYPSLRVAANCGYKAFICDPEQIVREDGYQTDNFPVQILLGKGRSIIALPYHRQIKLSIAFGDRRNADRFAQNSILPHLSWYDNSGLGVSWTDCETLGLHDRDPGAHKFMDHLLQTALPNRGVIPILYNDLLENIYRIKDRLPKARLMPGLAWTCLHGGPDNPLARWRGKCGVCGLSTWKEKFYATFAHLNEEIAQVARDHLGEGYADKLINDFMDYLANPGGSNSSGVDSLLSARASALTARTSCGTYFPQIGTSGLINILFGWQAIVYLRDAGVAQASIVEQHFLRDLAGIQVSRRVNGLSLLNDLLSQVNQGI